jgi:hypothetical protein
MEDFFGACTMAEAEHVLCDQNRYYVKIFIIWRKGKNLENFLDNKNHKNSYWKMIIKN